MSDLINKKARTLITVILLICLGSFCVLNAYNFLSISKQKITGSKEEQSTNVFSDIENAFREEIAYRNVLVDTFGVYQKTLCHNVVGNCEFVADQYGMLHMINHYTPYNTDHFIDEMKKLQAFTDEKQVPLLYVQAPNREIANKGSVVADFNLDNETMDTVTHALKQQGISVLDTRELLMEGNQDVKLTDLFFHTDLHMQTDAEIWMLNKVAGYLEDNLGIVIKDRKYLEDMSNYTKKSYEFLGNYGRSYGKYFVDSDTFDIYHPNFDTSYSYSVEGKDAESKVGSFEEVVLNGYENQPYDEYTYWVTNYMHFMTPSYTYVNQNQDDVRLLFITDSMAYRGMSYLSLAARQITVLDPRFFGGIDYIRLALKEEYDAVIVLQGNYLIGVPLLQAVDF